MRVQYGLLAAMLLTTGIAIAADNTETTMPAAEKTSSGNAADSMPSTASQPAAAATESEAAEAAASAPAAEAQTGFSAGSVVRSVFTTQVDNREPVDDVDQLSSDNKRVYYFTELRDMEGQTAKHRWEYNGEVMAEVEFNVNGPRWRVWSSKAFVPGWTGEWTVSVLNGANEVISEDTFRYIEETTPEPMSNPETNVAPESDVAPAEAE